MDLQNLETVDAVFTALGGPSGMQSLTGSKPNTVSMWKAAGSFPSNTYLVITDALRAVGKTAPDSLWRMKMPAETASCS